MQDLEAGGKGTRRRGGTPQALGDDELIEGKHIICFVCQNEEKVLHLS